jgi:hypothetical protein
MEWLEQNIDAYRIVSEILGELRLTVRQRLEKTHGEEWYREGLPEDVFKRLIASKEREKSIDWYEGQYQQIMDYAVFADLIEILEHNPEAFPAFMGLAPSTALLNARFLELDVMRAKLGRARPISETELSFLGTFHLRFRKAAQEAREEEGDIQPKTAPPKPDPEPEPETTAAVPEASSPPKIEAAPVPEPVQEVEPPSTSGPPQRSVQTNVESAGTTRESRARAEDRGDSEKSTPASGVEDDIPTNVLRDGTAEAEESDAPSPPKAKGPVDEISKTIGPKKLDEALSTNDHRTVLRELYREVTSIAEGVWSSEVTPAPMVWEQVISSDWYERNFSRLGLQPLSVFYEVTAKVDKKVRAGAERKDLQEFLKETNFAKTLLSLRDMFQANNI